MSQEIKAAYNALLSYAYGNGSPELAKAAADALAETHPDLKPAPALRVVGTPAQDWARVFSCDGIQILYLCQFVEGDQNPFHISIHLRPPFPSPEITTTLRFPTIEERDNAFKDIATMKDAADMIKETCYKRGSFYDQYH